MPTSVPEPADEPIFTRPLIHAADTLTRVADDSLADAANGTLEISPFVPPAIPPAQLALTQVLSDERLATALLGIGVDLLEVQVLESGATSRSDSGDPAVLRFSFAESGRPLGRAHALVEIDLESYPLLRIVLGREMHTEQGGAQHTREALALAVAELLLETPLERLRELGFDEARLSGIARGRIVEESEAPCVRIAYRMRDDTDATRHALVISLPGTALAPLDMVVARTPPAPALGDLPLAGRLVLGMKPLSVTTLQDLQSGDVLLNALFPSFNAGLVAADAAVPGATAEDRHRAPRAVAAWGSPGLKQLCAPVELVGHTPIITKEPYMSDSLDSALADAGDTTDQADDLIRIGELELPVQFVIDTVAMPLAQLSTLGPGYVIEFPVPFADARLRLVAHGRTIGYGELVTVGEHLGVRIIRMAHNTTARPRSGNGSV